MVKAQRFAASAQALRRRRVDGGFLVLPPTSLRDLPSDCVVDSFMGLPALRFVIKGDLTAMFLHDLCNSDIRLLMDAQCRQANAQLGADYARRPSLWEIK